MDLRTALDCFVQYVRSEKFIELAHQTFTNLYPSADELKKLFDTFNEADVMCNQLEAYAEGFIDLYDTEDFK